MEVSEGADGSPILVAAIYSCDSMAEQIFLIATSNEVASGKANPGINESFYFDPNTLANSRITR